MAQLIADDDYSNHPAIAAAFNALGAAKDRAAYSAAQDQLRKAELQRDIELGFTDLWDDWQFEQAAKYGLKP